MEEANNNPIQPDDEQAVFTVETTHCSTNEVQIMVMILPQEALRSHSDFAGFLQEFIDEHQVIPNRFEVKVGAEVIIQGGAQ